MLEMLRLMRKAWRTIGAPVLRDRGGAAAIFFAVGIVPLIGGVGLAVDSALGHVLRNRMIKSLDAAGLAASQAGPDEAEAVARAFFEANFVGEARPGKAPGETAIALTRFAVAPGSGGQLVFTAEATSPTVFMRLFGHEAITVSARSVVQREGYGTEVALVLDNTGSLAGSEMQALREASLALVDALFGGAESKGNLWVSLVPYTGAVNIGAHRTGWLKPDDRAHPKDKDFKKTGWKGCVEARPAPQDGGDTPPAVAPFTSFFYDRTKRKQDNKWPPIAEDLSEGIDAHGPNLGCATPIAPLSASRPGIEAAIAGMGAWHRGGRASNLGLAWGWRTLSPRWRGLWGGETPPEHPLAYDTPLMRKMAVIFTSGDTVFFDHDDAPGTPGSDYTAYGRLEDLGAGTLKEGREILETRLSATCAAMKKESISIYTVVFGESADSGTHALYRACASSSAAYFPARDTAELYRAFTTIGGQISRLQIVE